MAKISAIRQQVKDTERASIFVDGRFAFSLTKDQLLNERLRVGQEIDDDGLRRMQKLSTYGKIRQRTVEWLWRRPHSTRELRDYLRRKDLDDDQKTLLIDDVQRRGYQNDRQFAVWLIEMRQRQSKSYRQILAELAAKGVNREITAELMQPSSQAEQQKIHQIAAKKLKQTRYQQPKDLTRYLASKGYSFDDIKAVVTELTGNSDSLDE